MSSNKIAPAGETLPPQNVEADGPGEESPGVHRMYVHMFNINPVIVATDEVAAIHSPMLEVGAYESLWMSPSASFHKMAELLGAEYTTLPSDFVENDVATSMAREISGQYQSADIFDVYTVLRRDPVYPIRMLDAKHPVQMFYIRGYIRRLFARCVSVIGSKNPSDEAKERTARLTRKLVKNGFTIVSGLTKGIDTTALKTAMACGGNVIGVIGTSITECKPKANKMLQEEISENHLLVSHVPIMRYLMQTSKENRMFIRERNATISALSEATIIVEAGNGSDALNQARAAFHQKRKVLVMDSCFKDARLTWPARFKKRGAIRIRTSKELVKELKVQPSHISMESSMPLRQDGETKGEYIERLGEFVDTGIVPGYADPSEEMQHPPGSSAGKYWRKLSELSKRYNFLDWFESQKGGELLDDDVSLPPE